jgi:hypothetical protein
MTMTVKWHGEEAKAKAKAGGERGLYLGAEHVLEEATRLVPIAPSGGTLERSGHAWPPSQVGFVGGSGMQAAVTYDTPYAVKQHEELDYHHTRPGAQAKYLETPLNSERPKVLDLIAREIKRALGA